MLEHDRLPDPDLTSGVHDSAEPKAEAAIRSFLRMLAFNREYIFPFADLVAPFVDLVEKGTNAIIPAARIDELPASLSYRPSTISALAMEWYYCSSTAQKNRGRSPLVSLSYDSALH